MSDGNAWSAYNEYLRSGLWHVHTNVTDGQNTVGELLTFATENRFPLIGFVEHIRCQPTYDFADFYESVTDRAAEYDIKCAVGCEAKVVNAAGEIDVSSEDRQRADLVYAAFHGTEFDRSTYLESVYAVLENPDVDVWAHPFAYAQRKGFGISPSTVTEVFECAEKNDVLVEYNLKYDLSPALSRRCREYAGIIGYDLHDVDNW